MKKMLIVCGLSLLCAAAGAQFRVTAHQEGWEKYPPEVVRRGYGPQKSVLAQMDDDPQLEEVVLFGHDNGHWPEFDLFKAYYAIVDTYTREVEFISDEYVTDVYNLSVEDRNMDGRSELYYYYIKEGSFGVDERGYNKRSVYCYDRVESVPEVSREK